MGKESNGVGFVNQNNLGDSECISDMNFCVNL